MPTLAAWKTCKQQNRSSAKRSRWYPEPSSAIRQQKPGWCINTSRVPPPTLLPLSGGSNGRPYEFYFSAVANRKITIPPSRLRRATSLYTREAIRCGGDGPMSTREGQAASVTLLRREQLRKVVRPYKVHCVEAGNVPLLAEGDVWHILF